VDTEVPVREAARLVGTETPYAVRTPKSAADLEIPVWDGTPVDLGWAIDVRYTHRQAPGPGVQPYEA
jgi:hypothetical protein